VSEKVSFQISLENCDQLTQQHISYISVSHIDTTNLRDAGSKSHGSLRSALSVNHAESSTPWCKDVQVTGRKRRGPPTISWR